MLLSTVAAPDPSLLLHSCAVIGMTSKGWVACWSPFAALIHREGPWWVGDSWSPLQFDGLPLEEEVMEGDGSLEKELAIDNIIGEKIEIIAPVTSPSLDFNDNEDIPTELSDSSDTHDEGEPLNTCRGHPVTSPLCSLKGTGLVLEPESRFWISEHTPDQGQLGSQRKEVRQAKALTVNPRAQPSFPWW